MSKGTLCLVLGKPGMGKGGLKNCRPVRVKSQEGQLASCTLAQNIFRKLNGIALNSLGCLFSGAQYSLLFSIQLQGQSVCS